MDAEAKGTAKLVGSPSKASRPITANFRTEEIRGYLFKKTRDGKWQKRWFETNGCFLTYYKKQGQKLLAALNLPQVGAITLLAEEAAEGPGLFTIELNERVYTIKARSHEEAAFWVDALLWRQAGGVVTQKSPDVNRVKGISAVTEDELESLHRPVTASTTSSSAATSASSTAAKQSAVKQPAAALAPEEDVKNGACAVCCTIQ